MIRLVATDLDGTVVRPDGSMSERTAAALRAVEDAGLRLVFVTGRPPRWVGPVAEATGHRGLVICANGASVFDLHTERVVEQFPLPAATARRVVERVRRVLPAAGFAVEAVGGFAHDPRYRPRYDVGDARVAPIEDLLRGPLWKLLVRDESSTGDHDTWPASMIGIFAGLVFILNSPTFTPRLWKVTSLPAALVTRISASVRSRMTTSPISARSEMFCCPMQRTMPSASIPPSSQY